MNEDQKAELLDRLVASPHAREDLLADAGATPDEREELLSLAEAADLAWIATRVAPPLDEDPVAAMLGVGPRSEVTMDPVKFKSARTRANVSVSQLRSQLAARGWTVTTAEIASWQSVRGSAVLPATLDDVSAILNVPVSDLMLEGSERKNGLFTTLRAAGWFQELVDQWQAATGVIRSVAEAQLLRRATATVHRGDEPDLGQIRDVLQRLVAERQDPGR